MVTEAPLPFSEQHEPKALSLFEEQRFPRRVWSLISSSVYSALDVINTQRKNVIKRKDDFIIKNPKKRVKKEREDKITLINEDMECLKKNKNQE